MARYTGTVVARVTPRKPTASSPMKFDYVVDVAVEPKIDDEYQQEKREMKWYRFFEKMNEVGAR